MRPAVGRPRPSAPWLRCLMRGLFFIIMRTRVNADKLPNSDAVFSEAISREIRAPQCAEKRIRRTSNFGCPSFERVSERMSPESVCPASPQAVVYVNFLLFTSSLEVTWLAREMRKGTSSLISLYDKLPVLAFNFEKKFNSII